MTPSTGRTALVTGASRGIGRAIARRPMGRWADGGRALRRQRGGRAGDCGPDREGRRPGFAIRAEPGVPGDVETLFATLEAGLLAQAGASTPDSTRLIHDFWTTLYQAIDD
jgi:3-oxoacyl-[acyl-carrier protein] reductase